MSSLRERNLRLSLALVQDNLGATEAELRCAVNDLGNEVRRLRRRNGQLSGAIAELRLYAADCQLYLSSCVESLRETDAYGTPWYDGLEKMARREP